MSIGPGFPPPGGTLEPRSKIQKRGSLLGLQVQPHPLQFPNLPQALSPLRTLPISTVHLSYYLLNIPLQIDSFY